ncbi:unnamed protein product [Eruca vesicaria subsp. sativa]|uniref:Phorbol-ester/DAG-type domain-containing protein n=1 Tax=Eruca vesicaria subsp. sativa TaxID=29727 RepID=A0ABC8KUW8_ERUVS|nr:unnamed protein product [Eruca vesicaria subsp. sativa]
MLSIGHEHLLVKGRYVGGLTCDVCDRSYRDGISRDLSIQDGFSCHECDFSVHTKCIYVFDILETTKHPSHDGHFVRLLTTGAPDHTDPKCHLCGENTKRLLYHCSICDLNLDIGCMVDALSQLNMPWHYHPLLMLDVGNYMLCEVCGNPGKYGYCCPRCSMMVHEKCVSAFDSIEITCSCHTKHSLKLLTEGAPDYTDQKCHLCGKETKNLLYHCDICKFNMDMVCAIQSPIPLALSNLKVHEHTLTLIPRLISFVCDGCGEKGDRSPYVCFQCDLMFFHQECAHLPRVIHVNRHDHRVSYKYPLGPGDWRCEICLKNIDWSYGAYSCSLCLQYTLHSRCATSKRVWDGIELDGIPEEVEDIEPFKMNDDNTITHFAHEHNMSLNKDGVALEESILCGGCVRPIGSDSFYSCSECSFILHEICSNLPKKKRHFLSPQPLSLILNKDNGGGFCCACCLRCCDGFMYTDGNNTYDLLCSSITMPLIHGSHPHPLLYLERDDYGYMDACNCCKKGGELDLGCSQCKYYLDFLCATLPVTVSLHRYDVHPLTLCHGEKETRGKYWCDICERETNPETWFYTCYDCGVTLHVSCVVSDIRYAKPGGKTIGDIELVLNNTSSRPLCNNCHCRCLAPFFLVNESGLYCSVYCLEGVQEEVSSSDVFSGYFSF